MSRTKTMIKNFVWELGNYLIVIFLGFIAPRYIILIYGSEVNGLSTTVTQILNIILLLQSGATTTAIFSLYKPIADNDIEMISKNISATESFFKKIAILFLGIMLIAATATSIFLKSDLKTAYIFIAFLIMGLKSFLDLYFTSKFRIVFTAFQEKYVISIATLIEQIVYYTLVFLTLIIKTHFIFLYLWLFLGCVAKILYLSFKYKKYSKKIPKYKGYVVDNIKGRGYALANEVAHSVISSSTAIILSFMYGLQETSVFSVYFLVVQALTLVSSSIYSSFGPGFGNLVASENKENASRVFRIFQYLYVMLNSIMFFCFIILVVPFAKIYTQGATDIDYVNTLLACTLGLSGIFSAYRIPYNIIVSSCGFFKETWKQPVICLAVSLVISVVAGMFNYSLIILGPTVFYLINFIYQHFRIKQLVKDLVSSKVFVMFGISMVGFIVSIFICTMLHIPEGVLPWILSSIITLLLSICFIFAFSMLVIRKEMQDIINYLFSHFLRRRRNG